MKIRMLFASAAVALAAVGCAPAPVKYAHTIDYAAFKPHVELPRKENEAPTAYVYDTMPKDNYDNGHIPTAVNLPFAAFDTHAGRLPQDKKSLVIFYCTGPGCDLSHRAAFKAADLGYTNVKVYDGGIREWQEKGGLLSVSLDFVKKAVAEKADILLVDSRPERRVRNEGTIPGALNISDSNFEKEIDKLPKDKSKPIVFFCQGFMCDLSDKSAHKAIKAGYTNVRTFAAGHPAWKAAEGK